VHALILFIAMQGLTDTVASAKLTGNAASAELTGAQVFAQLSRLVGDWQGTGEQQSLKVSYRMTAKNTVLVETWTMSPTSESMTLYALDNGDLLATHFCPQGNQPRLRYSGIGSDGRFLFSFKDATNLADAKAEHQHALWLKIELPKQAQASKQQTSQFSRGEIYIPNTQTTLTGKEVDDVVVFERQKRNP
jgi:hypothetical protein